jgi:hypothetical protein
MSDDLARISQNPDAVRRDCRLTFIMPSKNHLSQIVSYEQAGNQAETSAPK